MKNKIKTLNQSPCHKCGMQDACSDKVERCYQLRDIVDYVFPRADFNYKDCSLYKVLKIEQERGQ